MEHILRVSIEPVGPDGSEQIGATIAGLELRTSLPAHSLADAALELVRRVAAASPNLVTDRWRNEPGQPADQPAADDDPELTEAARP